MAINALNIKINVYCVLILIICLCEPNYMPIKHQGVRSRNKMLVSYRERKGAHFNYPFQWRVVGWYFPNELPPFPFSFKLVLIKTTNPNNRKKKKKQFIHHMKSLIQNKRIWIDNDYVIINAEYSGNKQLSRKIQSKHWEDLVCRGCCWWT